MKTHKVRNTGLSDYLDGYPDTFSTFCGISDTYNPSEELMENLVNEFEECTCKNCQKAHCVFTHHKYGLTRDEVIKAIEILNQTT